MATKILILGANGAIAQHVIAFLKNDTNIELTLLARNTDDLEKQATHAKVLKGDVLKTADLNTAIKGQDIVYANLSGQVDKMAKRIVAAMETNGVKRLIFITSLGIYNEIPGKFGKWNEKMIGADLVRYRHAADTIENSSLDYTVIRPSWLTDKNETDYETTRKGEAFIGTEVARKAVATYVVSLIEQPGKDVKESIGVNKPGVYGDKPAFY
ncbi:MAG: NAD(P)H-binding protein [Agriterribacter sp.]